MQTLREMSGSIKSLFLARVRYEEHRCLESLGKMLREHAGELDHRRRARPVVVGAGRILGRLEARQRPEVGARATAGVVVAAHDDDAAGVASREPGLYVDDVHLRTVRMS